VNPHAKGKSTVKRGLAGLLHAGKDDRIPRQAAILIEGKRQAEYFPLVIHQGEGLAQLVFLD
jgi:hypothetical protein